MKATKILSLLQSNESVYPSDLERGGAERYEVIFNKVAKVGASTITYLGTVRKQASYSGKFSYNVTMTCVDDHGHSSGAIVTSGDGVTFEDAKKACEPYANIEFK